MAQSSQQSDPINIAIGKRLRLKRELLGLSQEALAREFDISRNKVIQFESGTRPVPASLLFRMARFFAVDVIYFYGNDNPAHSLKILEEIDPLLSKETIRLLKDFEAMDNPEVRKALASVIERASELLQK